MVSLHTHNIRIHEPMPWAIFEKSIQFEPITLENFIEILSKKETIFMQDPHENNYLFASLLDLLKVLPEFRLYLEYNQARIGGFDLPNYKKEAFLPFKNRIYPLFNNGFKGEYIQDFDKKEDEVKNLLKEDHSKKIIFIGKDHLRPGNGVHTFSPDLSTISVVYGSLNNKIESNYNQIINIDFDTFFIEN